jgi:hypothetical protein
MVSKKISALVERTSVQAEDLFVVADADEGLNYKVPFSAILDSIPSASSLELVSVFNAGDPQFLFNEFGEAVYTDATQE